MNLPKLTNKKIDAYIAAGVEVRLFNTFYKEVITCVIVSRDKFCFNTKDGSRFERRDLVVLPKVCPVCQDAACETNSPLCGQ